MLPCPFHFELHKTRICVFLCRLIALGLSQFISYLGYDPKHPVKGRVLAKVSKLISQNMLPSRNERRLARRIFSRRKESSHSNPIKQYFETGEPPRTAHLIFDLNEFKVLPPCERPKEELPYQWKTYLYPKSTLVSISNSVDKQNKRILRLCHFWALGMIVEI